MVKRYFVILLVVGMLVGILASVALSQEPTQPAETGIQLLRSDRNGVTIDFLSPKYSVEETQLESDTFDRIVMKGTSLSVESGRPQVPVASALIGVPPNADVSLRVVAESGEQLDGQYSLAPAPSAAPLEDDLQPGQKQYDMDPVVYERDAFYPQVPARIVDDAWFRDQRVVRVEVYPFQYNPVEETLLWHRNLQVELSFEGGDAIRPSNTVPATDSPFETTLRETLLNYETAQVWRATDSTPSLQTFSAAASSDPRYKIVVDADGLYRVSYNDLKSAGMDVDTVDPATFHLTNQGRDVAVHVVGEGDNSFDAGDYVEFYGEAFRGDVLAQTDAAQDLFWLVDQCEQASPPVYCPPNIDSFERDYAGQIEKYTDENVYWLMVGGAGGPRMTTVDGTPSGAPTPAYYTESVHAEQPNHWYTHHFSSEDTWFWDRVQTGPNPVTRTYTTTLTAVSTVSVSATVRAEVAARSSNSKLHQTRFLLNDRTEPLTDTSWSGKTGFGFQTQVAQSDLQEGENSLAFALDSIFDDIYFNWFEIEYAREFQAEEDQLLFSHADAGTWGYEVTDLTSSNVQVFDVTDPLAPRRVLNPSSTNNGGTYTASFDVANSGGDTYLVAGASAVRSPMSVSKYTPADLTSTSNGADYIFITHPDFYTATQELAIFRANQGLRTTVVDINDVYNEFGYGISTPLAIKNFLTYAYNNWQAPAPTYVLLVGGGHWNFKGYNNPSGNYLPAPEIYMPPNLAFVDPWQGEVDATNLLATIVGDDPLPDLAIGRLPAYSVAEVEAAIDKTIAYEQTQQSSMEDWQRRVLFIADNNDGAGNFVDLSESIIGGYLPNGYAADRIYLNDYADAGTCELGKPCPEATQAIVETLNDTGTAFMNYVGHGTIDYWSHEQLFVSDQVSSLTNGDRLPVLLSMDCLDGYWIHPTARSLVGTLLNSADKGVVAAFSPTGLGVASGHDALHRGFYSSVFDDDTQVLGPATTSAKLALYQAGYSYDLLNTFVIFGDPALNMVRQQHTFLPSITKSP